MVVNPDYTHNAKVLINVLIGKVTCYFISRVTRRVLSDMAIFSQ
jgi:hypothetical protein